MSVAQLSRAMFTCVLIAHCQIKNVHVELTKTACLQAERLNYLLTATIVENHTRVYVTIQLQFDRNVPLKIVPN